MKKDRKAVFLSLCTHAILVCGLAGCATDTATSDSRQASVIRTADP